MAKRKGPPVQAQPASIDAQHDIKVVVLPDLSALLDLIYAGEVASGSINYVVGETNVELVIAPSQKGMAASVRQEVVPLLERAMMYDKAKQLVCVNVSFLSGLPVSYTLQFLPS